jgi:hypothetical protein
LGGGRAMAHVLRMEEYRHMPLGRRCLRGCGAALRVAWRGVCHPVTRRVTWGVLSFAVGYVIFLVRAILIVVGLMLKAVAFWARFI